MATEQNNVTNLFTGGMVKDVGETFIKEGHWLHARNAVNNSHEGKMGYLGNEPANLSCITLPYTHIGSIRLSGNRWAIFSTDDKDSEIGIFDETKCSYTKVVNDPCLNFSRKHLIKGVSRLSFDCGEPVYFADAYNPDRVIDLTNPPFVIKRRKEGDCWIEEKTNKLDCEQLRLAPLLTIPALRLTKAAGSGTLLNGTYQVTIAYAVNQIRVTDYLMTSNHVSIFDHGGVAGAVELSIRNTDQDFDEMEVVVISNVGGQVTAKRLGIYSTRQEKIYIDRIDPTLPNIPLEQITLMSPAIEKSDGIYQAGDYLLRTGVYTKPEFNYQPLANQIVTNYKVSSVPADYYHKGGENVGYLRGEVYSFFIRWIYNTGERSASYHIPGRDYNTSSNMEYWESKELYPDDQPEVWGSLCGKPIRHHKFPDTSKLPHFNQGGGTINILGVEFSNIKHPVDGNGNPITSIVGYEILRGSREGNKSIIAKGMIGNMKSYSSGNQSVLYQNYPYNDPNAVDPYFNQPHPLASNFLSFHSPDTVFQHPYLGNGMKLHVYGELSGKSTGSFETPYQHPEFKFLGRTASTLSTAVGLLIGLMTALRATGIGGDVKITGTEDLPLQQTVVGPLTIPDLSTTGFGTGGNMIGIGLHIAGLVTQVALAGAFAVIEANIMRQKMLDLVAGFVPTRQYAKQYNSFGFYDTFTSSSKLLDLTNVGYIQGSMQTFAGRRINNIYRNDFVALQTSGSLGTPSRPDNSRFTLRGASPSTVFTKDISGWYGALKVELPSQYGQLESIRQIPISSEVFTTVPHTGMKFSTPTLFGGDTYIGRYTEKNPFYFFNAWLVGQPKDVAYDYRHYLNIPGVTFWVDTRKAYEGFFSSLSSFYSLDNSNASGWYVKSGQFYLFCNGVRDFFVESEVNVGYRDWGEEVSKRFYDPYGYTDISEMFRSDIIKAPGFYKYDYSLSTSRFYNQFISWGSMLSRTFDFSKAETCFAYDPRRVIYSLPQSKELKRDNWRSFLVNNFKDLPGKVTAVQQVGKNGALIMLEDGAPMQLMGVDTLQTDAGTKFTIGDGGLFNQPLQSLSNADKAYAYASCGHRLAVLNTPQGIFWVSQKQGKIFHHGQGLDDITRYGMKWWFAKYLPSRLMQAFPQFEFDDNPVIGVGVQLAYDNTDEVLYVTKKDYKPKPGHEIEYVPGEGFYVNKGYTTVTIPGTPTPTCPAGWVLSQNSLGNPICIKADPAHQSGIVHYNIQPVTHAKFGQFGVALYDPGYQTTNGTGNFTVLNTPFWQGTDPNGPANRITKWPNAGPYPAAAGSSPSTLGMVPNPSILYHDFCVDNGSATKTYYLALTGKCQFDVKDYNPVGNQFTTLLEVASQPALTQLHNNNTTYPVGYTMTLGQVVAYRVHIYPITLGPGPHIIRIAASFEPNTMGGEPAAFGFELYDNTAAQIAAATSYGDLNVVVSSRLLTEVKRITYNCPGGGTLSFPQCGTLLCGRVIGATMTPGEPEVVKVPVREKIELCDSRYFEDVSWTLSFDVNEKKWLSFHDWKPDMFIPTERHFITSYRPCGTTKSGFWKHGERTDKFCNFYGKDYPFEVIIPVGTGQQVTTLRNVEYQLDCFRYKLNGKDRFQVLDFNFDRAMVFNEEQHSGLLKLEPKEKNNPLAMLGYPKVGASDITVQVSKEEQKYRFNQFWDATSDRGEFTTSEYHMFNTSDNGYTFEINPIYVDYTKPAVERKKIRNVFSQVWLQRKVSDNTKMLLKIFNSKVQPSQR